MKIPEMFKCCYKYDGYYAYKRIGIADVYAGWMMTPAKDSETGIRMPLPLREIDKIIRDPWSGLRCYDGSLFIFGEWSREWIGGEASLVYIGADIVVDHEMEIMAEIVCDECDCYKETIFDIAPWFRQATDEDIVSITDARQWGACETGDRAVIFHELLDVAVFDMLKHCSDQEHGHTCIINEEDATWWIEENRPEVYATLIEAGIVEPSIVVATKD